MIQSGSRVVALALALAVGVPAPALRAAIRPAARQNPVALLVAIDRYSDSESSGWQASDSRVAALERMARLLEADFGVEVLLMKDDDATTGNLYRAFDELSARLRSGGQALVVLATATVEVEGVTRVATFDARMREPWALPSVSELRSLMSRSGDGGLLVADACVSTTHDSRLDSGQMQQQQRYPASNSNTGVSVALLSGCPLGAERGRDTMSSVFLRVLGGLPAGSRINPADLASRIREAQPYQRVDLDPGLASEPFVLERAGTPSRVLARLDDPQQRSAVLAELGNPKQAAALRGTAEGEQVAARLLEIAVATREPESLRIDAAGAVAAIGGSSAWNDLGERLQSGALGPTVGLAAVRALAAQGKDAAPALRAALEAPDAAVVKEAVSVLAALDSREDLPAMLRAAHRTGSPEVQIAALSAVRRLGTDDRGLAGPVRGLLEKSSTAPEVRSMAVLTLGELGDESSTGAIVGRLRGDSDPNVRQAAASALGQLAQRSGREQAVASLRAALADDSELVREAAVVALGSLGAKDAIAGLEQRLEDRAPAVRSAAAEALGTLDATGALDSLIEALGDEDSSVRRAAATAIGEIGEPTAHSALLWKSATDSDPYVRSAAGEALDRLGCTPLAPGQLSVTDRDPRVRAAELAWLSRCDQPGAGSFLLSALSDPDESVRRAAAVGLAALPSSEVLGKLEALARSGGDEAAAAIGALGRIGGDESLRVILEVAASENTAPELRVAAFRALGGFASEQASNVLLAAAAGDDAKLRSAALNALGMQARAYYAAEDWETGIIIAERYLKLDSGSISPAELAEAANNLAALYQRSGNLDRAQTLLEEALALREKALGPDHAATAVSLNNLAALYQARGEHERAEPLYAKALKIRERALPPGDPETVQSMRNLASLYEVMGRTREAGFYRAQADRAQKHRASSKY